MPSDSISQHLFSKFFWRHTPRSINMLCRLIVVCTITHTFPYYTKRPYFKYMPVIREHIIIPGFPSLPYALLPGASYHFAPSVFCYISF